MREAKSRREDLVLYGLPWTFPGWVTATGRGGTTGNQDLAAIANVLTPKTADYVARWVDGAQEHHNLSISYVGLWYVPYRPLPPAAYDRLQELAAFQK